MFGVYEGVLEPYYVGTHRQKRLENTSLVIVKKKKSYIKKTNNQIIHLYRVS